MNFELGAKRRLTQDSYEVQALRLQLAIQNSGGVHQAANVIERLANILHQLFPKRFEPSMFELISETTVSYSEILNSYKGWIAKVKRSNDKFLAAL